MAVCLAGGAGPGATQTPPAVSFDGTVRSTSGGFEFPDGTVQQSAAGSYAGVVHVATSGSPFSSVQAALDSIIDASASNRYLVRVGPGTYTEQVAMKPFVDIAGAGELATKITSPGFATGDEATLTGEDDVELRFLTVESLGGTYPVAILNDGVSPRILHVTASVVGGAENAAILNRSGAAPELVHVRAVAQLGGTLVRGIVNEDASPKLSHVDVRASFSSNFTRGIEHSGGGTLTMSDVTVNAVGGTQTFGIWISGSSLSMDRGSVWAEGVSPVALANQDLGTADVRGVNLGAKGPAGATAFFSLESLATFHNSVLEADGLSNSVAIFRDGSTASLIGVAHTQVIGSVVVPAAEISCLGAYDALMAGLSGSCQ